MKVRIFLLRWALPAAIYLVLQVVFLDDNLYLFAGWIGFCLGGNVMYYFGHKDRDKILSRAYGPDWKAAVGAYGVKRHMQELREKARLN